MFEINDRIEDLAIESKQLSSLGAAISQAMEVAHDDTDSFAAGIELFSSLLFNHSQKMNELFEQTESYNRES